MTTENPILRFHNCRIAQFDAGHQGEYVMPNLEELWVRSGRVIDPQAVFYNEERRPEVNIDCQGAILAPGLVDMQVNGGWGIDFSSAEYSDEQFKLVSKNLLKHGITSFCPTMVSSSPATYRQVLPRLSRCKGSRDTGAAILGVHIEGPFISKNKSGCHNINNICDPVNGVESLLAMYPRDSLLNHTSLLTIAPELPGSLPAIEWLTEKGILVSLGHSCATIIEGRKAVQAGARCVTHLFNAMLPFHHRDPGLVGLIAMETEAYHALKAIKASLHFGIIADGIHVHPGALRVVHRMAPRSLCLVSDQVIAAGLPDGIHTFPGLNSSIEVKGRKAYLADQPNVLAGAVTLLDECVRTFKRETECSIDYALCAASKNPASALNVLKSGQCGTLDVGAAADLILLDQHDFIIKATYIAGDCVYSVN